MCNYSTISCYLWEAPNCEKVSSSWPYRDNAGKGSRHVRVEASGKSPTLARSHPPTLIRRVRQEVAGLDQGQAEGTKGVSQETVRASS